MRRLPTPHTARGPYRPLRFAFSSASGSAVVPQDVPAHLMGLTLQDAVREGLDESEHWRADIVLDGLFTPAELRDRRLDQLSGGWRRLALLARTWVGDPDVLLLDEPTNHLDIEGQEALEAELLSDEATALIVSHDRSFVRAIGNRFWVIERRKLVEVDAPEAFFAAQAGG